VTIVIAADGTATYSSSLSVEGIATSELIPVGPFSAIHLHNAPAGQNGGVVQDVIVDAGGTNTDFSVLEAVTETDTLISIENVILSDDAGSILIDASSTAASAATGEPILQSLDVSDALVLASDDVSEDAPSFDAPSVDEDVTVDAFVPDMFEIA